MTHNVTQIQQRLILLKYLAPGQDDGKFGAISLDAYNHYRAAKRFGPVNAASMAQLDQDLFPEDYPRSNPLDNPAVKAGGKLLIDIIFNQLVKGQSPMDTVLATVKSAWLSKLNWTVAIGVVFNVLMFFGHPVPADVQASVVTAGNSIVLVVAWVIKTWFTTSITAASAKKL